MFNLLTVKQVRSGFRLQPEPEVSYMHSAQLDERKFYLSPGGSVYYVLSAGAKPVLWKIGRQRDGELDPLEGNAARHVLFGRNVFTQIVRPDKVSTDLTGSTWKSKTGRFTAKVIGVLNRGRRRESASARVVIAKYESNPQRFRNFSVRRLRRFKEIYRPDGGSLPDWLGIALDSKSARRK